MTNRRTVNSTGTFGPYFFFMKGLSKQRSKTSMRIITLTLMRYQTLEAHRPPTVLIMKDPQQHRSHVGLLNLQP